MQPSVIDLERLAVNARTRRQAGVYRRRNGDCVVAFCATARLHTVRSTPSWLESTYVLHGERLKVLKQLVAELGANRLRMKLDTPDGTRSVPHSHQDAVVCPRNSLELLG